MGLAQTIKFQFADRLELEKFVKDFSKLYHSEQKENLYVISSPGDDGFQIELAIEDYGLYIHRSGKYFEILGKLLEEITGAFGAITIEDY